MAATLTPPAANGAPAKSADAAREEFLAAWPRLRDELVDDELLAGQPAASRAWLLEMLEYNVPHGKLNRGVGVADALAAAAPAAAATPAAREDAAVVGWCIELLQAFFLVADDIMDSSTTRRGQPCWYRVPRVGMVAVNDGILLDAAIYRALRRRFGARPALALALADLFHDTTWQTAHGQLLDTTTAPVGTVDLARYTLPTYLRIVEYKTAYYTFFLPVAAGLRLAGVDDPAAYALAKDIAVRMGTYFQIQDDVLDAFGDPAVIGKVGTDIEDNKCSWLVVQALARASAAQRGVIEAHYGKAEEASVAAVKAVYRELDLQGAFDAYEAESHTELVALIEGQSLLPPAVFLPQLSKIYKRTK